MGVGPVWEFIKLAATKIPWARVAENTPLIVDALGRVKNRSRVSADSHRDLEEHWKLLQAQNDQLAADLRQMSKQVQQLRERVATLSKMAGLALLVAVSALILFLVK